MPNSRSRPLTRRTVVTAAALMLVAAPALAACSTVSPAGTVGPESAPVSLVALDGQEVTVPDGKPAALFFFSVGCGECVGGASSLATAAEKVGDNADYLAVDMDPSEAEDIVRGFLDYIEAPDLPTAIDAKGTLSQRFQVASLSTLIVVDADGNVTFRGTDPAPAVIEAELAKAGTE